MNKTLLNNKIFTINGLQIMIDRDLAELYNVSTKRLNERVKRNINRFPKEFRFQLTKKQTLELVANCDRLNNLKHSSTLPYAFTEQGVAMLSAILNSEIAIDMSIKIINAFVVMRREISNNSLILQRLNKIEKQQIQADKNFTEIFEALSDKKYLPSEGIFFDGQIYDAYSFVAKLIKNAKSSIKIIDNYIDDTVLTLLSKNKNNVDISIYTNKISKEQKLDLQKYQEQYPKITVKETNKIHDRFLIIDNNDLYHIGASLKDLGRKWFAFSKINKEILTLLNKLENLE